MLQCNKQAGPPDRASRQRAERCDMTKAKTAAEKASATAEATFNTGTEAFKAGLEKAIASYDSVVGYSKDTAEAYMKSATIAGKGIESINSEIYSYSKGAIEDSI